MFLRAPAAEVDGPVRRLRLRGRQEADDQVHLTVSWRFLSFAVVVA